MPAGDHLSNGGHNLLAAHAVLDCDFASALRIAERRLVMAEFGEQNGAMGQRHAYRTNLLWAFRIERRSRCVQAIAEVAAALRRIGSAVAAAQKAAVRFAYAA